MAPQTVAHGSTIVREVIASTSSGADVMSALPGLVRQLLDNEAWREFSVPGAGRVNHESFTAFVKADPPRGLGGRSNQLVALCGSDEGLAQRVRSLLLEEVPAASPQGRPKKDVPHSYSASNGTANHVVARLKRDDPAEAERVIRGEISADAAARAKGWRKPRIVLSNPESIATALRRYLAPTQIAELIRLLEA